MILAAMCRSPRRELRRLGAKALAALTWDGHADSRALGSDVREQWQLWVDVAVSREQHRLNKKFVLVQFRRRTKNKFKHREKETFQSAQTTPRDVAIARRQWALRRRRVYEGPNHANMRQLVTTSATWFFLKPDISRIEGMIHGTPTPLINTLLVFSRDRDQDCVLAAARGLAGVSFNASSAFILGRVDGLITLVVSLVQHSNPEVVSLACDVSLPLNIYKYTYHFYIHLQYGYRLLRDESVTLGNGKFGIQTTRKPRSAGDGWNC